MKLRLVLKVRFRSCFAFNAHMLFPLSEFLIYLSLCSFFVLRIKRENLKVTCKIKLVLGGKLNLARVWHGFHFARYRSQSLALPAQGSAGYSSYFT